MQHQTNSQKKNKKTLDNKTNTKKTFKTGNLQLNI